jgi:ABC-2 type transport system ATP-binding protein
MPAANAIETLGLTRNFGVKAAVDKLELRVPRGSIYGFLGPNGAGKTTTIRLILGLLRPTSGSILVDGEPFSPERRKILRGIGALVETPSLYPHLSGRENIEVNRRILDVPAAWAEEALALVELSADAHRPVRTYSLGMRQRLGLALAWLGKPSLLILDEPTNGLDPAGTRDLRKLLRQLVADLGATVLLSSHLLSEVDQIADHIGIIHRGRLLYQGRLSTLRQRPSSLRVSVDEPAAATRWLRANQWSAVENADRTISVEIETDLEISRVNQGLVAEGIKVFGLHRPQQSLEETFLRLISDSEAVPV